MSAYRSSRHRKRRPEELPAYLERALPESQLYTKLQKLEQRVDTAIARKHLEITSALRKPEAQRYVLRLFIHNTYSNQAPRPAAALQDVHLTRQIFQPTADPTGAGPHGGGGGAGGADGGSGLKKKPTGKRRGRPPKHASGQRKARLSGKRASGGGDGGGRMEDDLEDSNGGQSSDQGSESDYDFGMNWDEEDALTAKKKRAGSKSSSDHGYSSSSSSSSASADPSSSSSSAASTGLELQLRLPVQGGTGGGTQAHPEEALLPEPAERWSTQAQEQHQELYLQKLRQQEGQPVSAFVAEELSEGVTADGSAGLADPPSWSLKIQFQVLSSKGRVQKDQRLAASDFVKSLFIHLDPETFSYTPSPHTPASPPPPPPPAAVTSPHSSAAPPPQTPAFRTNRLSAGPEPSEPSELEKVIEWRQDQSQVAVDGFEVSRVGDRECRVRLELHLHHSPAVFQLSPALENLLGLHTGTLQEVLQSFWAYVRTEGLLQPLPKRWEIFPDDRYRGDPLLGGRTDGEETTTTTQQQEQEKKKNHPHQLHPNSPVIRVTDSLRDIFGDLILRCRPLVGISPLSTVVDGPLYLPLHCIPVLLRTQLGPPAPFVCDYVIRLHGEPHRLADVYDISVTAPELYFLENHRVLSNLQSVYPSVSGGSSSSSGPPLGLQSLGSMITSGGGASSSAAAAATAAAIGAYLQTHPPNLDHQGRIRSLNQRLDSILAEIREVDHRREFLQAFSESPVDVIHLLLAAQSVDLRLLEQHMTNEALRTQTGVQDRRAVKLETPGGGGGENGDGEETAVDQEPPHPILLSYASSLLLAQQQQQQQQQNGDSGGGGGGTGRLVLGPHISTTTFRQAWVADAVDRYLSAVDNNHSGLGLS